jgi:hypothetical protein
LAHRFRETLGCHIAHDAPFRNEPSAPQDHAGKYVTASLWPKADLLLDLQIPAKPGRAGADIQFGRNLLCDIQRIKGPGRLPVIIMTGFAADCLDMTTELHANGANEFIAKPFPSKGRTLASVVEKVLSRRSVPDAIETEKSSAEPSTPKRFSGGELVFHPSRVELLGVTIIQHKGFGQGLAILKELRRKDSDGQFVRLSGEELSTAIDAPGGVGTITGCIQMIRQNVVNRLARVGIAVGRDEVIDHDEQGYFLRDWIEVRDACDEKCPRDVPASVPSGTTGVPANVPATLALSARQRWVVGQLGRGVQLERTTVESQFGIGEKTAKRDLAELVQRGIIEFVRHGRGGCYRLRGR